VEQAIHEATRTNTKLLLGDSNNFTKLAGVQSRIFFYDIRIDL